MEHSGMNVIDLAVFAIILVSGLLALMRGFVREVLALAAWTGAGLATVYLYPLLRPWMHEHIKNAVAADIVTGVTLFCVALAVLIPAGYFLSGLVRGRALTAVDRSLGFVFGLGRGVLVVCLLFLLTLWLWPEKEKEPTMLADARTRPLLAYGAEMLKVFLPQDDIQKVTDSLHALDTSTDAVAAPLDELTTPVIKGADKNNKTSEGDPMTAPPPEKP